MYLDLAIDVGTEGADISAGVGGGQTYDFASPSKSEVTVKGVRKVMKSTQIYIKLKTRWSYIFCLGSKHGCTHNQTTAR